MQNTIRLRGGTHRKVCVCGYIACLRFIPLVHRHKRNTIAANCYAAHRHMVIAELAFIFGVGMVLLLLNKMHFNMAEVNSFAILSKVMMIEERDILLLLFVIIILSLMMLCRMCVEAFSAFARQTFFLRVPVYRQQVHYIVYNFFNYAHTPVSRMGSWCKKKGLQSVK